MWPGESVYVDYTLEAARRWWGDLHRAYTDNGVAGIWNDMNEPSDFLDQTGKAQMDVVNFDEGEYSTHAKNRNVFARTRGALVSRTSPATSSVAFPSSFTEITGGAVDEDDSDGSIAIVIADVAEMFRFLFGAAPWTFILLPATLGAEHVSLDTADEPAVRAAVE